MATIHVDGKPYQVKESDNLLKACLSLGFNVPYFCWHPILGSIGACRQCMIKQYKDKEDKYGKLIVSCMTPATEGTYISICDEESSKFRRKIIECLMTNHPHDCPVCDEGGHCHLQDMTVMVGHSTRRYRFSKRTHHNQYLGPFISHEMNRCITCYRCIRYYKEYADGTDLDVYGIHDNIYFGRFQDGTLENEFSGNLIEICPTGVFTDKTFSKKYSRKWDMQFAPSICHQCSVGCNISPSERYGEIRRIENRYHGKINHYFLCDRGRFGYEYSNLSDRPKTPLKRKRNNLIALTKEEALKTIVDILQNSNKIIGIGSPRASIESNFSLRKLVGAENFYSGISNIEFNQLNLILNILKNSGIYTPSLREIEGYDAILILGEDVTQTGARIALAIRQAIKNKSNQYLDKYKINNWHSIAISNAAQYEKYPLFITNIDSTKLDDIATWSYYAPIEDQARFGFAIANAINNKAPKVKNLDKKLICKVNWISNVLSQAKKPLIISGCHTGSIDILSAAANIAHALNSPNRTVGISFITTCVNSIGLAMMQGLNLDSVLVDLENGKIDTTIILENDLYRCIHMNRINNALQNSTNVMILDHINNFFQKNANLILPAANFFESSGTVINQEGRAQRFFKIYDPSYYNKETVILESWKWLYELRSIYLNRSIKHIYLDHMIDDIIKEIPELADIKKAAPDSKFRVFGQKLARSPNRYSGRTSMRANINVHEPRPPQDLDTMFAFSMEGNNNIQKHGQQLSFAWSPGWNSAQAWNKFQDEIGGNLKYGNSGIKIIHSNIGTMQWFQKIPPSFTITSSLKFRIVPYWHLFGSEETSQYSKAIQARMPKLYVVLNNIDASKLDININGSLVICEFENQEKYFHVKLSKNLSSGQIGFPIGFHGISPILIGSYVKNIYKFKE